MRCLTSATLTKLFSGVWDGKCIFINDPHHKIWSHMGIPSEGPVWEMSYKEASKEKLVLGKYLLNYIWCRCKHISGHRTWFPAFFITTVGTSGTLSSMFWLVGSLLGIFWALAEFIRNISNSCCIHQSLELIREALGWGDLGGTHKGDIQLCQLVYLVTFMTACINSSLQHPVSPFP